MADPGINVSVIYAVCTSCAFLRAYSEDAKGAVPRLEACPACGGDVIVRDRAGRFPPVYVSRVSREVLGEPAVERPPAP